MTAKEMFENLGFKLLTETNDEIYRKSWDYRKNAISSSYYTTNERVRVDRMSKCFWCGKEHNEEYSKYFCCEKCENCYDKGREMETSEDETIKCPYCEYEDDDVTDYYDYDGDEYICANCGKIFILGANITTTFTATPLKEEVEKIVDEEDEEIE